MLCLEFAPTKRGKPSAKPTRRQDLIDWRGVLPSLPKKVGTIVHTAVQLTNHLCYSVRKFRLHFRGAFS
jgi:hypothetical protein